MALLAPDPPPIACNSKELNDLFPDLTYDLVAISSTKSLPFPILRSANSAETRRFKFASGFRYPNAKDIQYAIWSFGDGSAEVIQPYVGYDKGRLVFDHDNAVEASLPFFNNDPWASFIPRTQRSGYESVAHMIPRFWIKHVYENDGTFDVSVTLVSKRGVAYTGESVTVEVDSTNLITRNTPDDWKCIEAEYTNTINTDLLYEGAVSDNPELPQVITESVITSNLPIQVTYQLTDIVGRGDVDYIEWNLDNGFSAITTIGYGNIVEEQETRYTYKYPFPDTTRVWAPTATIYIRRGDEKFKITLTGDEVNIDTAISEQGTTGVVVSRLDPNDVIGDESNNDPEISHTWASTPIRADLLPVNVKFTYLVQKDLQYIIMKFDDDVYETIPVYYNTNGPDVLQYGEFIHKYTNPSYYGAYPEMLFLYRDEFDRWSSKRYSGQLLNLVDTSRRDSVDRSIIRSASSYTRRGPISVTTLYNDSNNIVDLVLRLDPSAEEGLARYKIHAYQEIVWVVNGVEYVQRKPDVENFGYLRIEDFVIPTGGNAVNVDISAALYGQRTILFNQGQGLALRGPWQFNGHTVYDRASQAVISFNELFVPPVQVVDYQQGFATLPGSIGFLTAQEFNALSVDAKISPPWILPNGEFDRVNYYWFTPVRYYKFDVKPEHLTYDNVGIKLKFSELFEAEKPAANFLNRNNPSTVSKTSNILKDRKHTGYFTPAQSSNVVIEPGSFKPSLNIDPLTFVVNQPYYFADPYKYGNLLREILTFNIDINSLRNGAIAGAAYNQPIVDSSMVSFHGYVSHIDSTTSEVTNVEDIGYVHSSGTDLFGNVFSLVKNDRTFAQDVKVPTEYFPRETIIFNGFQFYDSFFGNGTSFDYYNEFTYGNTVSVPALSTNTNGFDENNDAPTIRFGQFNPFGGTSSQFDVININAIAVNVNSDNVLFLDGAGFTIDDNVYNVDAMSSDSDSWPGTGNYYYTRLFEGGVYIANPYQRPTDTLPADFTEAVSVSGDNGVFDANAAYFASEIDYHHDFLDNVPGELVLSSVSNNTQYTSLSTDQIYTDLVTRNNLPGSIYIKDVYSDVVSEFTQRLGYIEEKYGSTIAADISSNTINFDMVYNTYIIQTSTRLIIDRIEYVDKQFEVPSTVNYVFDYNVDSYNKISNRIKVGSDVYFAILSAVNTGQDIAIVPVINSIDITTFTSREWLPNDIYNVDDFIIQDVGDRYIEIDSPCLTYNDVVKEFNLSYLMKDTNKLPYLITTTFKIGNKLSINTMHGVEFNNNISNQIFDESYSYQTFHALVSSGIPASGVPSLSTNSIIL